MQTIFINSSNTVKLSSLYDLVSAGYENAATVTFTLRDQYEAVVSGAEDVSMPYVASSDGNYRGTLPSGVTADLTEGAEYYLDVAVVKGSKRHTKRVVCVAKYDDET